MNADEIIIQISVAQSATESNLYALTNTGRIYNRELGLESAKWVEITLPELNKKIS